MSDAAEDDGVAGKRRALRIYGNGNAEVGLIIAYLTDLRKAYNAVFAFTSLLDGDRRASYRKDFYPRWPLWQWNPRATTDWLTPEQQALSVPLGQGLILSAVSLTSPGFWEFVGSLNALEVLRKYLNDRHERRKDVTYRENAEQRRLALENATREIALLRERIALAREIGATDQDLAPLLATLIYQPLAVMDQHQDKGIIEGAGWRDTE